MMERLRGNRGTTERKLFDLQVEDEHLACLDGDYSIHTSWMQSWSQLVDQWLEASDNGAVDEHNVEAATDVAETIFKIGPLLTTQTLFFGRPDQGADIASTIEFIGTEHRRFADSVKASYFGDAFGVAVFKGKRQAALCYRHKQVITDEPMAVLSPVDLFKSVLDYIQQQKAERDSDSPVVTEVMPDPSAFRKSVISDTRYRTYQATLHHDIARYLLKKHFFVGALSGKDKELLDYHFERFENHSQTLPARFERPVRYDTKIRYRLYKGEHNDLNDANMKLQNFKTIYTEASLADHGIILETRLLSEIEEVKSGFKTALSGIDDRIRDLQKLATDYNLFCFAANLRALSTKNG